MSRWTRPTTLPTGRRTRYLYHYVYSNEGPGDEPTSKTITTLHRRKATILEEGFWPAWFMSISEFLKNFAEEDFESVISKALKHVLRVRYTLPRTNKKLTTCTVIVEESSKAVRRRTVEEVPIQSKKGGFLRRCPTKSSTRWGAT